MLPDYYQNESARTIFSELTSNVVITGRILRRDLRFNFYVPIDLYSDVFIKLEYILNLAKVLPRDLIL